MAQKKRKTKVSKGIHGGGGKASLSEVEKALMGKGLVASTTVLYPPTTFGRYLQRRQFND